MGQFNQEKRQFILKIGAGLALHSMSNTANAAPRNREDVYSALNKSLRLYNIHTQENICIAFNGEPEISVINSDRINYFFRDHRANATCEMDIQLLLHLYQLQTLLGTDETFELISGFRTETTNKNLRRKSNGVARVSYHVLGRAVDVRLRGIDCKRLHKTAISMRAGGVGYYPKSNFVHIDTGPIRHW